MPQISIDRALRAILSRSKATPAERLQALVSLVGRKKFDLSNALARSAQSLALDISADEPSEVQVEWRHKMLHVVNAWLTDQYKQPVFLGLADVWPEVEQDEGLESQAA